MHHNRFHLTSIFLIFLLFLFFILLNLIPIAILAVGDGDQEMGFFILRAEAPAGAYDELAAPDITSHGMNFTFRDNTIDPGTSYRHRVDVEAEEGRRILFETEALSAPARQLVLDQNHPNPFNPSTTITYCVPERCRVVLEVFDISGRQIASLVDPVEGTESHSVEWNGTDASGNPVSSGTHFYRLKAGNEMMSRKMILLK
jgi:hypothetical protein